MTFPSRRATSQRWLKLVGHGERALCLAISQTFKASMTLRWNELLDLWNILNEHDELVERGHSSVEAARPKRVW